MLRYKESDLVNTLIHETVHATLYIKSNADFNERLATFMGNWGTELYYKHKEGVDSKTVAQIKDENIDEHLFADFIGKEIKMLEDWYNQKPPRDEARRLERLQEIQKRFLIEVKPRLKTKSYKKFPEVELNNARLLVYKTYLQDLSVFEKLARKTGFDYGMFLERVKTLEKHPEPEAGLKKLTEPETTPTTSPGADVSALMELES